jgi:hypothetical protein
VPVEALVHLQLAELLADHHHLGLVVDALLRQAADVAAYVDLVVQSDEGDGIER